MTVTSSLDCEILDFEPVDDEAADFDILIYDCEIIKMIPPKPKFVELDFGRGEQLPVELLPGIEYCKGWGDHKGMGISVIGYCYGLRGAPVAALPEYPNHADMAAFQGLASSVTVVGFSSRGFDDKLCACFGIAVETDYDLLEEIRIAAGYEASFRSVPKGMSYKLDAIARANGMAKTGSGELAPKLWQQGKRQEVIDYCLHDVAITRDTLKLGLEGKLVDPNTGNLLQLRPLPKPF